MKDKKTIFLGLITLFFFGIGGILIIELYLEKSFIEVVQRGWNVIYQLTIGIIYGLISSMVCLTIINRDFFKREKEYYRKKVAYFDLNYYNIIFLSLCAGIGEEIFFRAALQPILGIWPTAIIFVLLHGYLNPWNWRINIYGFFMVLIMVGIGNLYEIIGLISVMIAHTIIDVILFLSLIKPNDHEVNLDRNTMPGD